MIKKEASLLQLAIFSVICFVLFVSGTYFFLWENVKYIWLNSQFLLFSLILSIAIISLILFFRQSLLSLDREVNEKLQIQKDYLEQLNNTYEGTLKALAYMLDLRDHSTWGHSARVVSYALALAEQIGLAEDDLRQLAWAGLLHDIGKIGIPDSILFKPTALNKEEWENIKRHPTIGYRVIQEIDFLKFAADIVLSHHERFDGTGYPQGLKGDEIPPGARIFAVADALDAMTSDRPYRMAQPMEKALKEIGRLAGTQFCPQSVAALEKLGIESLKRIHQEVKNISDVVSMRRGVDPLISICRFDQ